MRLRFYLRLSIGVFILGFVPSFILFFFLLHSGQTAAFQVIWSLFSVFWSAFLTVLPWAKGKLFLCPEGQLFWGLLHLHPLWLGALVMHYIFNFAFLFLALQVYEKKALLVRIIQLMLLLVISFFSGFLAHGQRRFQGGEIDEDIAP